MSFWSRKTGRHETAPVEDKPAERAEAGLFADEDNPNAVEVDLSEDWHREVFARAKRKTETGVFLTGTPTVRIGVGNMFIKNCPRSA